MFFKTNIALPQIAGLKIYARIEGIMPNSWLPQVAGLDFSSQFCRFLTYFSTANWGILEEFNISLQNRVRLDDQN